MKVVQYDTVRIVREWVPVEDIEDGVTPELHVRTVVEQTDEERWISIIDHVADHAPDSLVTTVVVYDDEGKAIVQGSVKSTSGQIRAEMFTDASLVPNVKDGELSFTDPTEETVGQYALRVTGA